MGTQRSAISAAAQALVFAVVLTASIPVVAGSLGDLAASVRKGTGGRSDAARPVAVRLTSLRPDLSATGPKRVSLDAPRENTVSLHEAQSRLPGAEEAVAGIHNPQGLHFEDASATVSPNLIRLARNYHHDGLPVVKLWQANRNMVAIGLNPHGVPGIFFTQALGK
jgi:hypothetical protein